MLQSILLFALFTLTRSVSAIYSNSTAMTTTTLAPSYSLEPYETTVSYTDETTTYFVTSIIYSTHWLASTSATITDAAPSSASGSTAPKSTPDVTSTSTITSTLLITVQDTTTLTPSSSAATTATTASASHDGSNNKDAKVKSLDLASTSNGCVPITKFVTVTNEPVTQYVTVTPNMTTQYVTVTGAPSVTTSLNGSVKWFNSTSVY